MELEVGMYVRTLKGIVKIDEIKDGVMKDTKDYLHFLLDLIILILNQ